MIVTSTTVGPFQENSYLVADETTGRAVYIDPGDEGDRLLDVLRQSGATLDAIWLTHAHVDHVGGIAAIRRLHDVPVLMHPADAPLYERAAEIAAMYGIPFDPPPAIDAPLAGGQRLRVGGIGFDVIHVPGHAPGHVAFVAPDRVFGGDLLFRGSIGRTDLPYCDPVAMSDSLARISALPESHVVHPGHGEPTTIGRELHDNPFLSGVARVIGSGAR
jgi:glyoxylase-like metal-dependent hydrolase (beta-lactamase superfamily II)